MSAFVKYSGVVQDVFAKVDQLRKIGRLVQGSKLSTESRTCGYRLDDGGDLGATMPIGTALHLTGSAAIVAK